jgi:TonB family protein
MAANPSKRRAAFPLILAVIVFLHAVLLALAPIHEGELSLINKPSLKVRVQYTERVSRQTVRSSDSEKRESKKDAFLSDRTRAFDRETKVQRNGTFQEGDGAQNLTFSDLAKGLGHNPFKAAARDYVRRKNGRSASNDYLKDIPTDDSVNLNTVEFKYYGFYLRIRQKLEQFWGRSLHETAARFAKDGRQVSAGMEHVTALRVTLNASGDVIEIEVLGASGVKELDEAAIESFNEAGPFPNPPKDLIVDGKVTLEWGFVVQS